MMLASVAAIAAPARAGEFRGDVHLGYDSPSADYGLGIGSMPSAVYGVSLGYDFDFAPMVFAGVEVSLDQSTAKECAGAASLASPEICVKYRHEISGDVRLGTTLGVGKLYALAGYARQKMAIRTTDGVTASSASGWAKGWRVGAGYQFPLMIKGYGKVEYRYTNFQGQHDRHQVLVGVGLTM